MVLLCSPANPVGQISCHLPAASPSAGVQCLADLCCPTESCHPSRVCCKVQAVSCSCCALQHRLEQAERLNAQLEAKVAQLELQQKSLQAQNEILSKVGWATASRMGGGPDLSLVMSVGSPGRGLQSSLAFSLWLGSPCQAGSNTVHAVGSLSLGPKWGRAVGSGWGHVQASLPRGCRPARTCCVQDSTVLSSRALQCLYCTASITWSQAGPLCNSSLITAGVQGPHVKQGSNVHLKQPLLHCCSA